MQKQTSDIAIIIVNYNSSHYTLDCVHSVIEKTDPGVSYAIVVIDNNSTESDFDCLRHLQSLPQVLLFRSRINLGFSGGNMLGVQLAKARYYYFLNNDCLLMNDCLNSMYRFCEQTPQAALCSGQMYDENLLPQPNFDYFPSLSSKLLGIGLLRQLNPRKYPEKKKIYSQPLKVDLLSGSSLFVRASVFDEIGGFDTNYFLYCEEEDIAFRIHKKRYDTYLIPEARFQHLGGKSTSRNLLIEKEFYISFLYFYRKHYGRLKTVFLQTFLFFKLAIKTFKHHHFLVLAFFVLSGAPLYKSLKHKQVIID